MKKLILTLAVLLQVVVISAQKKNVLKDEEISAKTEWQIDIKNGVEVKHKDAEYKYDKQGNVLMEKSYNADGTLDSHVEYTYDGDGNVLTQTTYNSKGKVSKKEEYKYQGKLKVEKRTYGSDGKLTSRKIYEYTNF